jgi:hypothetical protein
MLPNIIDIIREHDVLHIFCSIHSHKHKVTPTCFMLMADPASIDSELGEGAPSLGIHSLSPLYQGYGTPLYKQWWKWSQCMSAQNCSVHIRVKHTFRDVYGPIPV